MASEEVAPGMRFGPLAFTGDEIELGEFLAGGIEGKVYKCSRVTTGDQLAVKVVDLRALQLLPKSQLLKKTKEIENEVRILREVSHKNCLGLIDIMRTTNRIMLVTELASGGELFTVILKTDSGFNEVEARHVFLQVLDGLECLHSKHILHRDLKPENVLVSSSAPAQPPDTSTLYEVKLCDFGLSKFVDDCDAKTVVGTPQYWAPEVLDSGPGGSGYDKSADLWSSGVLLHVMLLKQYPFKERAGLTLRAAVRGAILDPSRRNLSTVSDKAKDLMNRLLTVDRHQRLTLEGARGHDWITGSTGDGYEVEELLKELNNALEGGDTEKLRDAVENAKRGRLPANELQGAEDELASRVRKGQTKTDLEIAVRGMDAAALRAALKEAEDAELDQEDLNPARNVLAEVEELLKELNNALEGGDTEKLRDAVKKAKRGRLPAKELQGAEDELASRVRKGQAKIAVFGVVAVIAAVSFHRYGMAAEWSSEWTGHAHTYCNKGGNTVPLNDGYGFDMSMSECEAQCLKIPECITYTHGIWEKIGLHYGKMRCQTYQKCEKGSKTSTSLFETPVDSWRQYCVAAKRDRWTSHGHTYCNKHGNTVPLNGDGFATSRSECEAQCLKIPKCKVYTHGPWGKRWWHNGKMRCQFYQKCERGPKKYSSLFEKPLRRPSGP